MAVSYFKSSTLIASSPPRLLNFGNFSDPLFIKTPVYLAFDSKRKEVRTTFTIKLARRQQLNTKEYALQKGVSQCLQGYCCKKIPVVNLQTSIFCRACMLKNCFGTQYLINWGRFVDIQEFLRLLTYVPSNQIQLSTGHENYTLVFCRIAWKGSTDKKY